MGGIGDETPIDHMWYDSPALTDAISINQKADRYSQVLPLKSFKNEIQASAGNGRNSQVSGKGLFQRSFQDNRSKI